MATWPTSVPTDAGLYVAVNELQTNLSSGINAAVTTLPLNSTTSFPTVGVVLIDNEIIKYTGVAGATLTGCTRAFDGTSAATHSAAAIVSFAICATHHNVLKDEIKAVCQYLSDNLGTGATPLTVSRALVSDSSGKITAAAALPLLLTGGTLTGALAMGANKVTGLAAATANGDAVRFEQVNGLRILQVVTATSTTSFSTTSTSFADTALTATITPASSSSKILVIATGTFTSSNSVADNYYATLRRGSTNLPGSTRGLTSAQQIGRSPCTLMYFDSPATGSATSYVVSIRTVSGGASAIWSDDANVQQQMILVEIG